MKKTKVEKGVPVPHTAEEQLAAMEIGDSVFFKDTPAAKIRGSFHHPAIKLKMTIKIRTMEGGARMWRMS